MPTSHDTPLVLEADSVDGVAIWLDEALISLAAGDPEDAAYCITRAERELGF